MEWVENIEKKLTKRQQAIGHEVIKEIKLRIGFFIARWIGLFEFGSTCKNPVGRGSTTDSIGDSNWFSIDRGDLYFR